MYESWNRHFSKVLLKLFCKSTGNINCHLFEKAATPSIVHELKVYINYMYITSVFE